MKWRFAISFLSVLFIIACSEQPKSREIPTVIRLEDMPQDIFEDSLARLPLPVREAMDADGHRAYDLIVNPDSRYAEGLRGPIAMWLYSPKMAEHYFPASSYLRYETEKDQRLTELVILATAREVRSQYEWTAHEGQALRAGLEPEIIELIKFRSDLETEIQPKGLGKKERVLIALVRELFEKEKVSPTTFQQARELFGEQGLMDLVGLIGHYSVVNLTIKTFDVQLKPGSKRLLPDLW